MRLDQTKRFEKIEQSSSKLKEHMDNQSLDGGAL